MTYLDFGFLRESLCHYCYLFFFFFYWNLLPVNDVGILSNPMNSPVLCVCLFIYFVSTIID